MTTFFKIHIILFLLLLTASGCSDKNKDPENREIKSTNKDTSSAIIKYDITGTGTGAITITKFHDDIRVDLEKNTKDGTNKESRFISGGYVYFYVSSGSVLQPVKMKIVKDNNYPKGFSAFTDAGEITPRMKKTGTDMVAGFLCDVYNDITDGSTYSVFGNKYILKSSFGGNVITANSVLINTVVDSVYVQIPNNVEFRDVTQQ